MSGAQWNAVRRNDIDFIGIDAARAQLKPRVTFRQQTNKVSCY